MRKQCFSACRDAILIVSFLGNLENTLGFQLADIRREVHNSRVRPRAVRPIWEAGLVDLVESDHRVVEKIPADRVAGDQRHEHHDTDHPTRAALLCPPNIILI